MDQMDDDEIDYSDLRAVEISTLRAIYPELVIDAEDRYTFTLEVPVNPANAVTVAFPATGIIENAAPMSAGPSTASYAAAAVAAAVAASGAGVSSGNHHAQEKNRVVDTHELSFLPSLHLRVTLPESYPEGKPPSVVVAAVPPWLPSAVVARLEDDCARLWEEMGHDQVVFTYVDHIQQAADDRVFGLVNKNGYLAVGTEHKVSILNYDVAAKQTAFDKETFGCGICLDSKKGAACHRMQECGHVFCRQCLRDFYCSAIAEGDLASVRCLEPNCFKERNAAAQQAGKKTGKPKMVSISPGELLQIPIPEDQVKRYIDLKYKTALESDKNTIYCPRSWCNGAARSKKHKKPEGLALHESEDEDDEEAPDSGNGKGIRKDASYTDDRLAICEDCFFAFCSRCLLSWHGEFVYCSPPRNVGELAEEDKASLAYLAHHTTPCPTCAAPAQKTMGCNHMICFRCNTHFCYLCSSWLDPNNPYRHFGEAPDGRRTGCFNRLWELEQGDDGGGDGQIFAFHGGAAVDINDLAAADDSDDDSQDWSSDEEGDLSEGEGAGRAGNPHFRPAAAAPRRRGGRGVPAHQRAAQRAQQQQEQQLAAAGQRQGAAAAGGPAPARQVGVAREAPLVLRIALGADAPAPLPAAAPAIVPAVAPNNVNNNAAGRQAQAQGRGGGGGARGRGGQQVAGRGRGGDGRGRGGGGGGGRGRGRGRGGAGRGRGVEAAGDVGNDNLAMEAWVRNFVHLALEDNEDGE
ncbi:hypothetical protein SCUCBS95973_005321 [Sporothrix curviconia]|uniref:RBR-type E3 ubiquitin transferase n=1 Tax=Sporothrix curviconia TaxID=1260050 RepID=A0ABP0BXN3_9PEZI